MTSTLAAYRSRWNSKRIFEPWMIHARPYDLEKNRTTPEFLSERPAIDRFDGKLYREYQQISERHNIDTNAGRDYIHDQSYITPASTAVFQYVATSESSHTPTATDTTLTSEITDGNGLARAAGTGSHTASTNTSTMQITFNATGTYTAVQLGGLFTASSVGTMNNEATFSSTNLNSGDSLQLTWTITLG
jgi:hypothetical protein